MGHALLLGHTRLSYTVGDIYITTKSTSPASLFGGTWEQIKDRFLLAAGSSYSAGSTGGAATHTLTMAEMPTHEGHLPYNDAIPFGYGNSPRYLNRTTCTDYDATTKRGWNDLASEMYPVGVNRGGSQAHNNMPPYLTVYIWKRVA